MRQRFVYWLVSIATMAFALNCKPTPNVSQEKNDEEQQTQSASPAQSPAQEDETLSKTSGYKEIRYPTPNVDSTRRNTVEGVVLHHTAEPTIEKSLGVLTSLQKKVGTHCVIDLDGTRYIMCEPEIVTYHAGLSVLNGKEGCNYFTIGIEFQGNTLEKPLTDDQISSAIEYLKPLIKKYKIPVKNIVTHEMVRNAYKKKYPNKRCSGKVDITQTEYLRFMKALRNAVNTTQLVD